MIKTVASRRQAHKGPTTSRCADALVARYGFESLDDMAASIPEEAHVLDVGAGLSDLGNEVASRRPDIHWLNLDAYYNSIGHESNMGWRFDRLTTTAPENVEYLSGSILDLDDSFKHRCFARIFSYYVLPYIARGNRGNALIAMHNMRAISLPGGIISIGPIPDDYDPAISFIVPHDDQPFDITPLTQAVWYQQGELDYEGGLTSDAATALIEDYGGGGKLVVTT